MGVRPEFQLTLPALMRRRFGLRERTTIILIVLAVVGFAAAVLLVRPRVDNIGQVSGDGFTLQYRNDLFHEARPQDGELARVEGRRGRQSVAITVRPLELPPFEGDAAHALLPVYASGHIRRLAAELDGFALRAEHRARVNDAPGYEVRFRTGGTFGSDLMLVPSEEETEGALLVSLRRTVKGRWRLGEREEEFADLAFEAMRSITYVG